MWALLFLYSALLTSGVKGYYTTEPNETNTETNTTTDLPSCRYNCGYYMGSCSCRSYCQSYGNCCPDYNDYCPSSTTALETETTDYDTSALTASTDLPSCRYNCGYYMGSCSCRSYCQSYGNCCPDYNDYCSSTTTTTAPTGTEEPYTTGPGCGGYLYGSSGTFYSPNYPYSYPNNAVCVWYIRPGRQFVKLEFSNINLEHHPSCGYDAIYVFDGPSTISSSHVGTLCGRNSSTRTFYSTGRYLTVRFRSDSSTSYSGFRAYYRVVDQGSCRHNCGNYVGSCSCVSSCVYYGNCCPDFRSYCYSGTARPTTAQPSCRYNCGYHVGNCSCRSSCRYNGNCCPDYYSYCYSTPLPTTAQPSCRYNCGYNMGSCSCSSSCQYYGNCCPDYYSYCNSNDTTTAQPSCLYNCGSYMGSCSCSSSCQYYGNCCPDYYSYCYSSPTSAQPSCRYNCGYHVGNCSCRSSCRYNGNCCPDYYSYCYSTPTSAQPSCRYNCGYSMGSCSCSSSCRYNGNCCPDYYSYCSATTPTPTTGSCGGFLFGSGTFTSPNHPYYYNDNTYCVWQIKAEHDQRVVLSFTYLELENCCSCDYISLYDGPSVGSRYLGKLCNDKNNNTESTFYSTSNYMTVLFRTDGSVVARGFRAEFMSSLLPSSGRVDCSSDKMTIVMSRSYLNSVGYDGYNLYLNDPYCRPQVSSYQVVFSFPSNTCGNIREFNNGRVVYSNTVRGETSSYGEITRNSHFRLNVTCQMDRDSVSHTMFIIKNSGNSSIAGTGRFNTTMSFYTSSSFYYKVTQVPYEVSLNERVFVQVDLARRDSSLVLFIDTCVASPSQFDFQSRSYYLVRSGCTADSTYQPYVTGTRDYARFAFRTFRFLRAKESVYIQCKVLICQASDYSSRCRRGCMRRTARDLGSGHDSQTLVVGPIKLKDPEKKEEEPEKQDKA